MDDMQQMQVALVKIEAGITHLTSRLDESARVREMQHAENTGRLASIEREVRATNGRVNLHETTLQVHEDRIRTILSRVKGGLSITEVVRYIACIGGTYTVLKIAGLLK